ncbi:hypothetical protein HPB49_020086 [Dermacentor silvarum]|uniref:Uncharacterized protein n=1 Tax=Dermacentor silvarum TaxID=543639 RepID=A0ACB8D7Z3_DERSI|nr:hypothetical protein HPB49_020086 [Dermacentor silvarum]
MAAPAHDSVSAAKFGEYKFFVPTLPTQLNSRRTAYLHCDPAGRPYKTDHFVDEFRRLSLLEKLKACGPFLRNHFWEVCFCTPEDLQPLLEARELRVKERRCFVIDPLGKYVHVVLHWVPLDVRDRTVRKVLKRFGKVSPVTRLPPEFNARLPEVKWRTLFASMTLKEGLSMDNVPHKVSFKKGTSSLVVIVGRAPMCLRCSQKGHLRRNCKAPQCAFCARVGHVGADCPRESGPSVNEPAAEVTDAQPEDMDASCDDAEAEVDHAGAECPGKSAPTASESAAEDPVSQSADMDVSCEEATPGTSSKEELRPDVRAGGDHVVAEGPSAPAASEPASEDAESQSEDMDVSADEAAPGTSSKAITSKAKSYLRKYKPKKKKKKQKQKKR